MKKLYVGFLLMLMCLPLSAFGQATVRALHTNQSMVTHMILPFRISGVNVQDTSVMLRSYKGTCGVMQDPFIRENILVKCLDADQFWMQLTIRTDSGTEVVDYGPVSVVAPGTGVVIDPNPGDPKLTLGLNLFNANCASCHSKNGALRPVQGRSAAEITAAISSVSAMRTIVLTATEKDAIAYYLGK